MVSCLIDQKRVYWYRFILNAKVPPIHTPLRYCKRSYTILKIKIINHQLQWYAGMCGKVYEKVLRFGGLTYRRACFRLFFCLTRFRSLMRDRGWFTVGVLIKTMKYVYFMIIHVQAYVYSSSGRRPVVRQKHLNIIWNFILLTFRPVRVMRS